MHDSPSERPIIGRLNHLSTMGLAEKTQPGVWRVSADAPEILRAMGERGDIVRTLQRAIGGRHQALSDIRSCSRVKCDRSDSQQGAAR